MTEPTSGAQIESILFVTGDEGVSLTYLSELLQIEKEVVLKQIQQLKERYEQPQHGLQIAYYGEVYRLVTKPEIAPIIERLIEEDKPNRLSKAALEVLAIVAYKQPVTRVEIDGLRGVKSERTVQTLIGRGLIKEVGRAESIGRAILYGTTDYFLDQFGLSSITQLPELMTEQPLQQEPFMNQFEALFSNQTTSENQEETDE